MRTKILSWICALALFGTVQAAEMPANAASPTRQDMLKWKGEVLSKYEEIIYLDGNSGKISEDTFIHRVVAERRGFYMSVASATPKYITIRLFSDAEQRAATTTKK